MNFTGWIGDRLSVSALIGLETLTFDFLTLNLVRVITGRVDNLPTNFYVSGTLWSRLMGQQLSEGPRDLATLTFDLHRPRHLYVIRVCVLHLCTKFQVRRPSVRKIWRTSGLSISRPGDLDLLPLTLKLVRIVARAVGNLLGISRTFCCRLIGQRLSDASRDLATLTFDLGGYGADRWYGSSYSICVLSFMLVDLLVRKNPGHYPPRT